jgi:hypothetical protein
MMELAGHIEDSQGGDGVLTLMVRPQGSNAAVSSVPLQLETVGRFSDSFPFNCPRSDKLIEDLCDFIVRDYTSGNWKSGNQFYGNTHGESHQLLALMASGIPKYEPIIERHRKSFYGNTYNPADGGFRMWRWGFEAIVMGEMYHLYRDEALIAPMRSLAEAMPWGSFNRNGIYTHRSHINIRNRGGKPYASIAAISGLQMVGMSIFRHLGLHYEQDLYETIYQRYLGSSVEHSVSIAYAFPDRRESPLGRDARHAHVILKDASQAKSGKGVGYVVPTGMRTITEYTIAWPTKADPRWKPTDWVEAERDQNIVEELEGNARQINRFLGDDLKLPDPTGPYNTTRSGGHLAPVGMGAVALLMGSPLRPGWHHVGMHAANTCVLGPGNIFDGHAASNLHSFWSVLGAARSDRPDQLRNFYNYLKTFLILSQTHDNNGLYMQPWGRDRPSSNSDTSFGPRILPTATGVILLSIPRRRLLITGADIGGTPPPPPRAFNPTSPMGEQTRPQAPASATRATGSNPAATARRPAPASERPSWWAEPPVWARQQESAPDASAAQGQVRAPRSISPLNQSVMERALIRALHELRVRNSLLEIPMQLSISRDSVILQDTDEDGLLTFSLANSQSILHAPWRRLSIADQAILAAYVATVREQSSDAQALAGAFFESAGSIPQADQFFARANASSRQKLETLFD